MAEFTCHMVLFNGAGPVSYGCAGTVEVLGVRDMEHAAEYFHDCEKLDMNDRNDDEQTILVCSHTSQRQKFKVSCKVSAKYSAKAVHDEKP